MKKEISLTPKQAKEKVDNYFKDCDPHLDTVEIVVHDTLENGKRNPVGRVVKVPTKTKQKPYTVSGLASALGLTTAEFKKVARSDYIAKKGGIRISPSVKKVLISAIQRVEEYAEKSLYTGKTAGAQFVLKNIGEWKDKAEVDSPGLTEGVANLEKTIINLLKK